MGAIEHLTISLSADRVARLRDRVRAGEFKDESAAIEDALAEVEASHLADEALPPLDGSKIEQWLRTEVVKIYDRMKRDPSRGVPLDEAIARLKADRVARGE